MSAYLNHDFLQFVERETTQLLLMFVAVFFTLIFVTNRIQRNHKKYPPGPMGLPFVGYLPFLGEEPYKTMVELGKKYGNIFSLYMGTKYTVVLNDYEAAKEGLPHSAALDRSPIMFDHIYGGIGFGTLNGYPWQEQRRFCMHGMQNLGFGKTCWESLIQEEISSLINDLEALEGKAVDVGPLLISSVSNNVISLLIGRRLQTETESDIARVMRDFTTGSTTYTGPSDPASTIPGFRKLLQLFKISGYHNVPEIMQKAYLFIKKEINRHKSLESSETQDFIKSYLDQIEKTGDSKGDRGSTFSEKMLEGNINMLFLGGSDTISSSLCYMVRLLAAYPDVQKKIQRELESVIGRADEVRYEERNKTPYTFAAILETMRFSTIVPLSITRLVSRDFELAGYTIPKGTEIFSNTWAIHNDPRYWKEPEKFLPQRFLSQDGTKILKLPSYLPFSIGKRNCPGETVASMELYLYLTSILQKFNISTAEGEQVRFNRKKGLVNHLEPQNLCFTLRKA